MFCWIRELEDNNDWKVWWKFVDHFAWVCSTCQEVFLFISCPWISMKCSWKCPLWCSLVVITRKCNWYIKDQLVFRIVCWQPIQLMINTSCFGDRTSKSFHQDELTCGTLQAWNENNWLSRTMWSMHQKILNKSITHPMIV